MSKCELMFWFPWEVALAAVVLLFFVWVLRRIRRRRARTTSLGSAALPHLETLGRVTGTIRRVARDADQGVWLVTIDVRGLRLVFCATDHERVQGRYQIGKPTDVALFALATLDAGGAEAMRQQIRDWDKVSARPDLVALVPGGQFANDYAVIGRVLDRRDDVWDEMALTVYRTEVIRRPDATLVLDLALPRDPNPQAGFAPQTLVHGSARMFGYLAP